MLITLVRARNLAAWLWDAELEVFIADLATFESEALVAMQGAATHTDISWFRDLHEWKMQHGVSAYNDDHALMKATLDEKLRRMHVIAEKLEAKIRDRHPAIRNIFIEAKSLANSSDEVESEG